MNLILIDKNDYHDDKSIVLKDHRAQHVREILKSGAGDCLEVGEINGLMGSGRVIGIDESKVEMSVKLDRDPPPPMNTTLVLALPRPIVLKRMLVSITALGVKKIVLIQSKRVEKSYWSSPVLEAANLRRQMMLGLEQSKDTILPEITLRRRFKPFIEDDLSAICQDSVKLLAHPGGTVKFPVSTGQSTVVAIGPEGGFIPYEVERFKEFGFDAFSLGPRILKVETAVCAVLSKFLI